MQIRRLHHPELEMVDFAVADGEAWCFYGDNHSGINTFLQLLSSDLTLPAGSELSLPSQPAVISFALQQEIYEDELAHDDSDFLNRPDPGTLAAEFLPAGQLQHPLIDRLHFREALGRGIRQLSSGQNRKLLILKALLTGARQLIIDCPYDGLDGDSCQELDIALQQLVSPERQLYLLVRNSSDIPAWCSHLGLFARGRLIRHGRLAEIWPHAVEVDAANSSLFSAAPITTAATVEAVELIRLRQGFAGYDGQLLFCGLNLTIHSGDHTLITGPNGCGKSTLLHILTGDHPKCYANDLRVFGHQRGSGESIWQLKKEMGIVSPELHRNYRVPGSALMAVLSGLHDSIGLYHKASDGEKRQARQWLALVGLADQAGTPFRQLSYGDQRLVLIARALIKMPRLLVLDEPTQGLDQGARLALLDFLERLAGHCQSTIIYVSHRQDEFRPFFRQHLRLEQYQPSIA